MRIFSVIAILLLATIASAQDPFAPPGGKDDPFGGGGEPVMPIDPSAPVAPTFEKTDPVIAAIKSRTPADSGQPPVALFKAAKLLFDYRRYDIAEEYFAALIASSPTTEDFLRLRNTYGTGYFSKIARSSNVTAATRDFAHKVIEEADKASRDPKRIADLISKLSAASAGERNTAFSELRNLGLDAIIELVTVMANDTRSSEHPAMRNALVAMGDIAIGPIMGALESGDDQLIAQAATVLGRLEAKPATAQLVAFMFDPATSVETKTAAAAAVNAIVGVTPNKTEAVRYLRKQVEETALTVLPDSTAEFAPVTRWTWDRQANRPIARELPIGDASRLKAAQISRTLFAIDPRDPGHRRKFLTTLFEAAVIQNGLGRQLPTGAGSAIATADNFPLELLGDALTHAMKNQQNMAAIGLAQAIGARDDLLALDSVGGELSPLAKALESNNQRLRFAAAEAVMKLDPKRGYAGSSQFLMALAEGVQADKSDRVIVAMPQLAKAQDLVAILSEGGYRGHSASNGKDAFRLAARQPNVQLIIVSLGIDKPPISHFIQELRNDSRTADIPIGLMFGGDDELIAEAITRRFAGVLHFPTPQSRAFLEFQVNRLIASKGRNHIPAAERLTQATSAVAYADKMLHNRQAYSFYNLHDLEKPLLTALRSSTVGAAAATALGGLGTPNVQKELVNVASGFREMSVRRAAAAGFAEAVEKYSLLLSTADIELQYDRYNQSEFDPAETQQVLSSILDAMEAPLKKSTAEQ